jgi:hypothetical protein
MKAYEITEAGKEALRSGKYKMVRAACCTGRGQWVGRGFMHCTPATRGAEQCMQLMRCCA